jgi:hypothetical protein
MFVQIKHYTNYSLPINLHVDLTKRKDVVFVSLMFIVLLSGFLKLTCVNLEADGGVLLMLGKPGESRSTHCISFQDKSGCIVRLSVEHSSICCQQ